MINLLDYVPACVNSVFCIAYVLVWSWMDEMKVSSVLAPWCVSPQWQTLLEAPTSMLIPVFEIERVIELLSFIFAPPSLVSLWLNVFYLSVGGFGEGGGCWLVGWLVGEEEEEGGRDEEEVTEGGSVAQVVVMKGVFHSFTLPVFPLFSCLRRLIKRAWIVDVTLSVSPPPPPPPLFLVSHPHILPSSPPSLSILTLSSVSTCDHRHPSSHSLAHNASQWPLTGGQRGKKKKKKNKLKFSLNVNIEAADLYFLYFLFTQCERKCQGHSMATLLFTPMFIQMDFSCRQ